MLDANVNSLTFHNMDQLFTTRTVARSGAVWPLPRADHELNFTYTFKGASYTPAQFLERTYTNALLVMKHGRIVAEIYRNNTGPATRFMAFSMTKSITSLLIGRALEEKRIQSLDDPITRYLPELKSGGYDGVTIRQILQRRIAGREKIAVSKCVLMRPGIQGRAQPRVDVVAHVPLVLGAHGFGRGVAQCVARPRALSVRDQELNDGAPRMRRMAYTIEQRGPARAIRRTRVQIEQQIVVSTSVHCCSLSP
jgi:hypothetical protein